MEPGSDWLANIFLFTFLFGLVFTVVSLFLGASHVGGMEAGHDGGLDLGHDGNFDVGHADVGHADVGHADVAHADGGAQGGPSIFNLPTIMAFLTWFGGAGYIFTRTLSVGALISVPMALISGLTGGAIMFVLLSRLLWPMMSKPMSKSDYRLPGTAARVVSAIRAGGVGEVVYSKGGIRFTAGARAVNGEPVPRGAEVVIIKYERGLAYVQPVDELLDYGEEEIAEPEMMESAETVEERPGAVPEQAGASNQRSTR
jgi:membrane protein implicated in regulation of membrane protease activity